MDVKQLKIFCTVADRRSFSLAGEKLGLTQPTISFQIASLERELGTRLLDRGGAEHHPHQKRRDLIRLCSANHGACF
ncbi:LysR family transcriptional regulator [Dehalococcoidia bacterium]|nr:LysR family transcriptional regulator [Dehalococcoidia bacterium]